jgi:hypothetical protein
MTHNCYTPIWFNVDPLTSAAVNLAVHSGDISQAVPQVGVLLLVFTDMTLRSAR